MRAPIVCSLKCVAKNREWTTFVSLLTKNPSNYGAKILHDVVTIIFFEPKAKHIPALIVPFPRQNYYSDRNNFISPMLLISSSCSLHSCLLAFPCSLLCSLGCCLLSLQVSCCGRFFRLCGIRYIQGCIRWQTSYGWERKMRVQYIYIVCVSMWHTSCDIFTTSYLVVALYWSPINSLPPFKLVLISAFATSWYEGKEKSAKSESL